MIDTTTLLRWRIGAQLRGPRGTPPTRMPQGRRRHSPVGRLAPIGKQVRWGAELGQRGSTQPARERATRASFLFEDEEAIPPVRGAQVREAAAAGLRSIVEREPSTSGSTLAGRPACCGAPTDAF